MTLKSTRRKPKRASASIGERKQAQEVSANTEGRYRALFENMLEGCAYCQMLFEGNRPQDFIYLAVNPAFETLTGLQNIVGRRATELFPGVREIDPELFEIYGRVARTGQPARFEHWFKPLDRCFHISVYSIQEGHFVAVFDNITERKRLEEKLRETEEQYRIAAESVSDVIVTIDQDSRIILFANGAIEKVFGYSSSELSGKEITTLMPERYRDAHVAGVKRYAETGIKHLNWKSVDVTGLHKSGKEIPLEASYGEYVSGQKRYFVGVLRDVTESRRATEALNLFRALIDRSSDMIEVVDPGSGRLLDINVKGCLDLGYSREELLALNVFDLDPTVDQSSFTQAVEALRNAGVLLWEGIHRRKDGSTFPVEVHISHVQLDREYAVAVVRDITARKRAEAKLREDDDRTNFALAAAGMGVWEVEFATNRLTWSDTMAPVFGLTPDRAPKTTEEFFQLIHPDDRHDVEASIGRAIAGESNYAVEFRAIWPDGSTHWVNGRAQASYDADGKVLRLLGIGIDITTRKALEGRFEQAQKMEAIGQLAGGIAHDFNNLLTVINGTAELALLQVTEGNELHEDLHEIRRAGERAAALTRQLLAFSRKQILQPRVINLNAVLVEMENMLRRLIGEDVDLVVVPAQGLGSVKADPGQVEQVVANLVVNARDAMPKGGKVTIEMQNVEIDEQYTQEHGVAARPGPYVMMTVTDTGVGMDEATKRRIFEPFFTTKGPSKGTGLGLSTAYGIVEQSGGFIWVYSEVGQGTSFKLYLPQVAEVAGDKRPSSTVAPTHGTETILLVEDVEGLRRLARRMLESANYTVLTAANGEEAVLVLERHEQPVHLMITDVVMPGMSGPTLAEQFEATCPGMKVLYMSGYTDDVVVRHGVLSQGMPFISKPFAAAALIRKVREVLDS